MKLSFSKEGFRKNFVVFNNWKAIISYQFIVEKNELRPTPNHHNKK